MAKKQKAVVAKQPSQKVMEGQPVSPPDMTAVLTAVGAQSATYQARQREILGQLAAATGLDLEDLLFLFGLTTGNRVVGA